MGDVELREGKTRFMKVDEDDDEMFKFDCGSVSEDRIPIVGKCPKEREMYVYESDRIDKCRGL